MAGPQGAPIVFAHIANAALFNAFLDRAGSTLTQLRNTLGDGTANPISLADLQSDPATQGAVTGADQALRQSSDGDLVRQYSLSSAQLSQFRSAWDGLDADSVKMSENSAGIANQASGLIEPTMTGKITDIRNQLAMSGRRDKSGRMVAADQLWGIDAVGNTIDHAARSVSNTYNAFQMQIPSNQSQATSSATPSTTIPPIVPPLNFDQSTDDSDSDNGETGHHRQRYQTVSSDMSAQPLGQGQVAQAKGLYDHLVNDMHLTPAQASGILGNLQVESSLNTGAWNGAPGEDSYGLAQWRGNRLANLKAFAASRRRDISDPQVQLDFILWEMQHGEDGAWEHFAGATDPASAAAAFDEYYERSSGAARGQRMGYATTFFNEFNTGASSAGRSPVGTGLD